jgi:hypothetical protein
VDHFGFWILDNFGFWTNVTPDLVKKKKELNFQTT